MDTLSIFLVIIAALIALWINYLLAGEFYTAALAKGYPHKKYFWICFFLGVIGYLLVIALPQQRHSICPDGNDLPDL